MKRRRCSSCSNCSLFQSNLRHCDWLILSATERERVITTFDHIRTMGVHAEWGRNTKASNFTCFVVIDWWWSVLTTSTLNLKKEEFFVLLFPASTHLGWKGVGRESVFPDCYISEQKWILVSLVRRLYARKYTATLLLSSNCLTSISSCVLLLQLYGSWWPMLQLNQELLLLPLLRLLLRWPWAKPPRAASSSLQRTCATSDTTSALGSTAQESARLPWDRSARRHPTTSTSCKVRESFQCIILLRYCTHYKPEQCAYNQYI